VVIYNRSDNIEQMFAHPRYVLKNGIIIIDDGELRASIEGRQFAVTPSYDPAIEDYLRPLFQQYYTISFENYPVAEEHVPRLQCLTPAADGARTT